MLLQVDNSIIGWDSKVGSWSRLENCCVLGEDVTCKVRASVVLPEGWPVGLPFF